MSSFKAWFWFAAELKGQDRHLTFKGPGHLSCTQKVPHISDRRRQVPKPTFWAPSIVRSKVLPAMVSINLFVGFPGLSDRKKTKLHILFRINCCSGWHMFFLAQLSCTRLPDGCFIHVDFPRSCPQLRVAHNSVGHVITSGDSSELTSRCRACRWRFRRSPSGFVAQVADRSPCCRSQLRQRASVAVNDFSVFHQPVRDLQWKYTVTEHLL